MRIGPVEIKYVPRLLATVDRFTPDEREALDRARRILLRLDQPTWLAQMVTDDLRHLLYRDELHLKNMEDDNDRRS